MSTKYDLPFLWSNLNENGEEDDYSDHDHEEQEEEDEFWDFLTVRSVVAVANQEGFQDCVWFIKITDNDRVEEEAVFDSYNNCIIPGVRFLKGHFLERSDTGKDFSLFKVSKLVTFFYRETILYPFVPLSESKKGLKLMNNDYSDIIKYAEKNGYNTFWYSL